MKKHFTYILSLLALVACTNDDGIIGGAPEPEFKVEGVMAVVEAPVGLGDSEVSRSSLAYSSSDNKMMFQWDDADKIGVFPYGDNSTSQQVEFLQRATDDKTSLSRSFQTSEGVRAVPNGGQQYMACFPPSSVSIGYENVPVDYTGQTQNKNIVVPNYPSLNKTDHNATSYAAEEKLASEHLGAKDYLCATPVTSSSEGDVFFSLKRVGAIVRFYIRVPASCTTGKYCIDQLQLVNNSKEFTTKGKLNLATKVITPTETSHVMNLNFNSENFDMSDVNNIYNSRGYIVAYMMIAAPINLQGDDVEKCTLYLVAHEKETPGNKHYFKATGLSKPNLTQNAFYKWTVDTKNDTPIEFSEVTVEEWREGTTFENNGTGTEKW